MLLSIVVEKHFISTILELLNVISMNSQLIYSIYTIDKTTEGGRWSPHIVFTHLSVDWIHVDQYASTPLGWTICFLLMMPGLIKIFTRNTWLYVLCTQMFKWDGLWWPSLFRHICPAMDVRNDWHAANLPYKCVCGNKSNEFWMWSEYISMQHFRQIPYAFSRKFLETQNLTYFTKWKWRQKKENQHAKTII